MGGVISRTITRNRTVRTGRFVLSILIDINNNPEAFVVCVFAYLVAVLRCAAAKITIDSESTPHGTCCFFVDACRFRLLVAVAVAVVLSVNMESPPLINIILFADTK